MGPDLSESRLKLGNALPLYMATCDREIVRGKMDLFLLAGTHPAELPCLFQAVDLGN
jgi:hypothetical protein